MEKHKYKYFWGHKGKINMFTTRIIPNLKPGLSFIHMVTEVKQNTIILKSPFKWKICKSMPYKGIQSKSIFSVA